jgi:hypothetical protein
VHTFIVLTLNGLTQGAIYAALALSLVVRRGGNHVVVSPTGPLPMTRDARRRLDGAWHSARPSRAYASGRVPLISG